MNPLPPCMFELDVAQGVAFNPWPHSPTAIALKRVPLGSKLLDVGCAAGYMARECMVKNCLTWGVELSPVAAELARRYCVEVAVADLDRGAELPFGAVRFDCILCLDVLEHLARPDIVLRSLVRWLAPEGKILISLPNIARLECRLALLAGRFDYELSGIMSKGHLRFFTKKTSRELVRNAGLEVVFEQGTGFASILRSYGICVFETLTSFQWFFECRRKIGTDGNGFAPRPGVGRCSEISG